MSIRRLTTAAVLFVTMILGIAAVASSPAGRPTQSTAEAFQIDPAHSTVTYRIRHFDVSWFHGRIQKPRGEFLIEAENLSASFIRVELEMKNMDAGNSARDQFLKSPDFFNVKEFPTATFTSHAIRSTGKNSYEVEGEFTMHGVTKRIIAPLIDYAELSTKRFGYRAGFECTFTVKRSDYGVDLFVEEKTLGDETRITVAIEGADRTMNDTAAQALMGVAVPFVFGAGVGFAFSGRRGEPTAEPSPDHSWRIVLALVVPVGAAFLVTIGWPDEQWHRLFWVPLVAGVVGMIASLRRPGLRARTVLMAVLAAAGLIILWPTVRTEHAAWAVVTFFLPLFILVPTEFVVRRRDGGDMPIAFALAAGSAAAVILISGMLTLSVIVAALGFALAGLAVPAIARRRIPLADGPLYAAIPLLTLALLVRHLYSVAEGGTVPLTAFLFAACSPLGVLAGEILPAARRGRALGGGLRLAGVLVLGALAVTIALNGSAEEETDDPYADLYRDMMSLRLPLTQP